MRRVRLIPVWLITVPALLFGCTGSPAATQAPTTTATPGPTVSATVPPSATAPASATPSLTATAAPTISAAASPTATSGGQPGPDPDGRIAFGRLTQVDPNYGPVVALFAIDPDGSDLAQLTNGDSAFPAWSPDGKLVAFTQREPDGNWQIATMAADGSNVTVLTSGPGVHEVPGWAPDGSWIAYDYSPDLFTGNFHTVLYRMNADGSQPKLLGKPDTFDVEPRVSPDGARVVFARLSSDGSQASIVVRDLATGKELELAAAGTSIEHPSWSVDGQWIIYNFQNASQILRIRADGSGQPVVILDPAGDSQVFKASYSPDGKHIVFGCKGTAGDDAMCTMNADGSNAAILVDKVGTPENFFAWGVTPPAP